MRCQVRHDAFDVITPDSAYWLGFLFADGSVSAPGRRFAVRLTADDEQHLVKLRTFLGSTHTIGHSPAGNFGGYDSRPSCRLSIRSERLASRLLELGRYNGSIADDLANSPHFWRGVVDGDGSIGVLADGRPYIGLVGSRRNLEAFRAFLGTCALGGRMSVRPTRSIFVINTTGRVAAPIIDALYGHGGTALDRKARIAKPIIEAHRTTLAAAAAATEELRVQYDSGASLKDLATIYEVSNVTILRRMQSAGIKRRPRVGGRRPVPICEIDVTAVPALAHMAPEQEEAVR